jgi:hypothetical protein
MTTTTHHPLSGHGATGAVLTRTPIYDALVAEWNQRPAPAPDPPQPIEQAAAQAVEQAAAKPKAAGKNTRKTGTRKPAAGKPRAGRGPKTDARADEPTGD